MKEALPLVQGLFSLTGDRRRRTGGAAPMIIQAHGLRKRFQVRTRAPGALGALRGLVMPRRRRITAVDDIELAVDRGEVIAFIGPNGAGKSMTIKLLTGILHRDAGTVSVLGMDPQRHRRRLAYRIATVFGQKSQLWFHLPPIDTFRLLADVYDLEPRRARQRIASLTEIFGIEKHLTTPVRKLSLGERIRCEIAASLIHDPELLLLDEPTIGLDVVIRQRIRDLIAEVNRERGVTVFLTSHDTGDIEKVCRRAVVINHGRIVWDGAVGELRGSLLATKIMDLKLEAPLVLDQPDVTIRHAGRYTATLEVDTRRTRIEAVVRAILKRNTVLDITISDPPMEEVIAALYESGGNRQAGAPS
ncbi:MAG: ATP-binding cassette domain-containing protein [Spirochaetaceae bacterium]|nr:ATP-binding cassette domain-containing protein [Spirochaetaceae bacterium]